MKQIEVTVLMPAYNTEKYIGEAIQSVLDQTFTDFELLIINDGSTDGTEGIIRSFSDTRIVVINQPNGGVSKALNTGLRHARAKYIARFDADDICCRERLAAQFAFMEANPDYVLSGSNAEYIDMNGEYIFSFECAAFTDDEIRSLSGSRCPFLHVSVMYHKHDVMEAGGYDENAHTFEDHLLWATLIQRGKVCNLPEKLVKVRFNPESLTIDEKWRGKRFNQLKYTALQNRHITKNEGDEILSIIREQDTARIKKGSYYSLLAKKYLWNNYNPGKARRNIQQLIRINPLKPEAYLLLALSFFPAPLVKAIYKSGKR